LHDNLLRDSHKPYGPPPQSHDCSCYVSGIILVPPPLRLQEHADLRPHDLHSPKLWHQRGLPNLTCTCSWRLYGNNPATVTTVRICWILYDWILITQRVHAYTRAIWFSQFVSLHNTQVVFSVRWEDWPSYITYINFIAVTAQRL